LSKEGDHEPVYPLSEVVGNAFKAPPSHIGATAAKVGVILGFTVTVREALIAHCPAVGVKVYAVVAVLFNAGDHEPTMLFSEVVGKALKLPPSHIGLTAAKVGNRFVAIFTVAFTKQPLLSV
jgi:hypothetical protein